MFKGHGLIFIGGAPRSGTTLVQRIVNAHPDIYGGPEFDLIPDIIRLKTSFDKKIGTGRIEAFLKYEDVSAIFSEFIKHTLFIKKENEGVKYISEKTPSNILVFNELIDFIPQAKYVFVVRDPRAVVSSMLEVRKRSNSKASNFNSDVVSAVRYINKCWDSGCQALQKHPSTILIQYENLVLNQSNEVLKLFKGLELDEYEVDLKSSNFEYSNDKESWKHWYTKEQFQSDIYSSSLEKWKQKLKPYQLCYIECSIDNSLIRKMYLEGKQFCSSGNIRAKIEHCANRVTQKMLRRFKKHFWRTRP